MRGINDNLGDRGSRRIKQSRHVDESGKHVGKKKPKRVTGLPKGNGKKMKGKKNSNGNDGEKEIQASGVENAAKPPSMSPTGISFDPTAGVPSLIPDPTQRPSDDSGRIVSCGDVPESATEVEIAYLYNVRTSDSTDIELAITSIEAEIRSVVASAFVVCEGDRRLLSELVGVSALPKDLTSGSCGTDCTNVVGGMTLYVENEESSDPVNLKCEVFSMIRDTMINIESRPSSGIDEIDLADLEGVDCAEIDAKNAGDTPQQITGTQAQQLSGGGQGISSAALAGIAAGFALVTVVAFLLVRRLLHSSNNTGYASTVDDKDNDLLSVMTPDTAGESRQSPLKSTPDRESSFATLPSTPEQEISLDSDGSPIAQFNPALLDATNKASNNVNTSNHKAGCSRAVGLGGAFFAQFKHRPLATNETVYENISLSDKDFMYDGADDDIKAVLMEEQSIGRGYNTPLQVSPMMEMWHKSASKDSDGISTDSGNVILTAIPEVDDEGDEHSVATAEVSNVSPETRSQSQRATNDTDRTM